MSGYLRCDICGARERMLLGREGRPERLCNDCFERLDGLDRDHADPAFLFAAELLRNRDAARMEGIE